MQFLQSHLSQTHLAQQLTFIGLVAQHLSNALLYVAKPIANPTKTKTAQVAKLFITLFICIPY
jgi:hypothetical protein